jgi:hypothetical protein
MGQSSSVRASRQRAGTTRSCLESPSGMGETPRLQAKPSGGPKGRGFPVALSSAAALVGFSRRGARNPSPSGEGDSNHAPRGLLVTLTRDSPFPYARHGVLPSSRSFPSRRARSGNIGAVHRNVQQPDAAITNHHHSAASDFLPGRSVAGHRHQRAISLGDLRLADCDRRHRAGINDVHAAKWLNVRLGFNSRHVHRD